MTKKIENKPQSKTQLIMEYGDQMPARDVVTALADRGIDVSTQLVYAIRSVARRKTTTRNTAATGASLAGRPRRGQGKRIEKTPTSRHETTEERTTPAKTVQVERSSVVVPKVTNREFNGQSRSPKYVQETAQHQTLERQAVNTYSPNGTPTNPTREEELLIAVASHIGIPNALKIVQNAHDRVGKILDQRQ